ncbi:MAG TPA: histidine kinase dimerization/phospho-acceptor domain-containing protein, partial [Acidimicrobiales bacterium]
MRPLDRIGAIKLKFGLVIVAAVVVTLVVHEVGNRVGLERTTGAIVAAGIALVMVQLLARGMTSPLREMAAATRAMARGEHHHVITASSRDEVGDLARAFNHMAAELAEVDRVRRDLVANVSHELRTPISSLQAVLENLVDGVAEPDRDTLRSMLTQVERLGRMVSQLLDLSRLESGTVPIDREPFAVGDVLDDVAELARVHTATAIEVDCPRPSPVAVGDRERVHQVVANLVENALRHSPEDAAVVVRTRAREGKVVVEVADRGPGI